MGSYVLGDEPGRGSNGPQIAHVRATRNGDGRRVYARRRRERRRVADLVHHTQCGGLHFHFGTNSVERNAACACSPTATYGFSIDTPTRCGGAQRRLRSNRKRRRRRRHASAAMGATKGYLLPADAANGCRSATKGTTPRHVLSNAYYWALEVAEAAAAARELP